MPQYRRRQRNAAHVPITQDDVFFLLEPLVGLPLLLKHSELSSDLAALLTAYDWRAETALDALFRQVERTLFNRIYDYTDGKMEVQDARGKTKKVTTEALEQVAEALMGPLFERFPVCERTFELLNAYALRHLSLPALKRLYTGFAQQLQPMNRSLLVRIVTENFPEEAYREWLGM